MRSIINELKTTLRSHDTLNPKLWKNEKLDPEVYLALNKIAKEWATFANIPSSAIKDIKAQQKWPIWGKGCIKSML